MTGADERVCVVCVFFTITDRVSNLPSNICGCQSVTCSAGQENIRGTSIKLQREHDNKNKTKQKRQKEWNDKNHMAEKDRRALVN